MGNNTTERNIIIDVGMHDGKDAHYYASRGYHVIAFEANPQLCNDVVEKLTKTPQSIEVRNRAISDSEGDLTFYINRFNSTWSSLKEDLGSRRSGSDAIKVKACRLDVELSAIASQIHFVKIDIEGYDAVAVNQLMRLPSKPTYISVENGSIEMLNRLSANGYDGFKLSNQKYVPFQKIPKGSIHGKVVDRVFEKGASGLWGEDLDGRWFNADEMKTVISALAAARGMASGNLFAESIGWFDMHARRSQQA